MTTRSVRTWMARGALAMALAGAAPAVSAADPAKAKQANSEGMRLHAQGEHEQAMKAFERAIAEEPTLVKAHYNRASMAALLGDWPVVAEEFAWLRAATNAEAARVLAKSRADRDFAGARLVDEGRVAMGYRTLADTPLGELVLESAGKWSGIDEGMMEGFLEYTFAAGGKVKARSHSGESGRWYTVQARWKVVDGAVVVTARNLKETWRLGPCGARNDSEGMCLQEEDGSRWLSF